MNFKIDYCIFEDKTLEQQLGENGYTLGDKAEFCEELRNAFNMYRFYLLTDSQSDKAFLKLHKIVQGHAKKKEVE